MATKKDTIQKLRLRIKSYDHKLIDNASRDIIDAAERNDAKICGPIPLPTEIKRYTVNRSTFIDKNSREQFELRVHKRLVEMQLLQHQPGQRPNQRLAEPPQFPADNDEPWPKPRQFVSRPERIGDHRQVGTVP